MSGRIEFDQRQSCRVPFEHYLDIYQRANPTEIAARTGLPFDAARSIFSLRLLGTEYEIAYPDFEMRALPDGAVLRSPYEEILIIRYLCEGQYAPASGRQLSYAEIPWGAVYLSNFNGRVLRRFAREFGEDSGMLRLVMEENAGLHAVPVVKCDAGYRFEFITGLYMSLLLWEGDAEFPPSAQMLFDDNFKYAFTAEDVAVAGEIAYGRLNELKSALNRKVDPDTNQAVNPKQKQEI
ncbi:MAG: DUF3786 domain-containing protein [Clostridiales Family XIII bacterium]|jgi:hypothetical protein|nr:DUF3786 domain-containing protein [Clostridiales Family XIII bacterium]